VRSDSTHHDLMESITRLFSSKKSEGEFNIEAFKIYSRYKNNIVAQSILLDIEKRQEQLLAYRKVTQTPKTNNLIESYNSHLQGRVRNIKGFE